MRDEGPAKASAEATGAAEAAGEAGKTKEAAAVEAAKEGDKMDIDEEDKAAQEDMAKQMEEIFGGDTDPDKNKRIREVLSESAKRRRQSTTVTGGQFQELLQATAELHSSLGQAFLAKGRSGQ